VIVKGPCLLTLPYSDGTSMNYMLVSHTQLSNTLTAGREIIYIPIISILISQSWVVTSWMPMSSADFATFQRPYR
jgi:hypothetical protein